MSLKRTIKIPAEKRRTCTKCGRLGHLSTTCDVTDECRHDKVGIEVEGYWDDLHAMQVKALEITGRQGNTDGSLPQDPNRDPEGDDDGCGGCDEDDCEECHPAESQRGKPNPRPFEFQTRPGSLGEGLRQLIAVYPDGTNRSCGMHVHMSFKDPSDVTALCSDAFFRHYRERYAAWGKRLNVRGAFWERLEGTNSYCKKNDMAADFDRSRSRTGKKGVAVTHSMDRYRQINFQAWNEHQTVEFRLLPMFQKASIAVSAIEELVDIVESYLASFTVEHDASATDAIKPKEGPIVIDASTISLADALVTRSVDEVVCELPDLSERAPGTVTIPRTQVRAKMAELFRLHDI